MARTTTQAIIEYITRHGQASGKELADFLGTLTPRSVRKQLKNLLERDMLKKIGRPPKVFYLLASPPISSVAEYHVDGATKRMIDDRYLYISPTGEEGIGWEGFVAWCQKTHQDPNHMANVYKKTLAKYDQFRSHGLIDGIDKMRRTFDNVYVDSLFYLDFYSIEQFGKTKLGQTLLYAKQSQNILFIQRLIETIRPQILSIVHRFSVDGVAFIPPTVKREVQLMKELEKRLHAPARTLTITKVKTPIAIPQKTLTRLEDRVENAQKTIIVEDAGSYTNILLVDDAVGSGATLNETAKQIRHKGLCSGKIIGLAITGSFKGFDVISEV